MEYKVILVDVDDTLLDFRASARQAMERTLLQFGMVLDERFWNTYWEINSRLWKELEAGRLSQQELFSCRFRLIFARLGLDLDADAFEQAFHAQLYESAVPFEGARPFLAKWHGRVPVFAATNGWQKQQEHRLFLAGLSDHMDGVFSSEQAGALKPARAYYDYVFQALRQQIPDLERSRVVMVGDSWSADMAGAAAAGFETWYVAPGTIGEDTL